MNNQSGYLDIIKTVASCLALIALIIAAIQIRLAKKTIKFNSFKSVYDDNFRIRRNFEKATRQRNELTALLKQLNLPLVDIGILYGNGNYNELREMGYHYEYIGILVRQKILPFGTTFELISFPDKFWNESADFIAFMRSNHFPDFWGNFEYLKKKYEKKRKDKTI